MRVALYARVSSEKQDADLSISAQLKALREYAERNRHLVVKEYVDESESGRSIDRPGFRQMIAAARQKNPPFEAILVWKYSRFARSREDSIVYKSLLRKHGVRVISINEPVDDSPAGKLLEGVIEVIDEFYSSNLAEDVLRGMKENAEKGFWNGGVTPFGYLRVRINIGNIQKSKIEPEESEALLVARVFQMALAAQGSKEIAKALNRDGLRTRSGKLWGKTTISYMLQNEIYTGTMIWRGKGGEAIRYPDKHTALVSKEDFDKAQQLLNDRRSRTRHPRTVASKYLLSSLFYCAKCGSPMIGCAAKSSRFSYYRCNNALRHDPETCRTGWIPQNKIEGFVIDRLKERVLTNENRSTLVRMVNEEIGLLAGRRRQRLEEIEKQVESVNQKLLKYYIAFEKGTMTDEDAAPRIRQLRDLQTRLQRAKDDALADLEDTRPKEVDADKVLAYVVDLKALLSTGTFTEQKTFLRSFIKRIDFEPGQVAINYTIPMPLERGKESKSEVLSLGQNGGPFCSIDRTQGMIFKAVFAFA